jgi:hypothetical protein
MRVLLAVASLLPESVRPSVLSSGKPLRSTVALAVNMLFSTIARRSKIWRFSANARYAKVDTLPACSQDEETAAKQANSDFF